MPHAEAELEAQWIQRVLVRDDRHAFRQLVLLHQSALRVFLRRLLGDPGLADDSAQEAWITAYQKISTFRGGSFRSWLYTIAARKAGRIRSKEGRTESLEAASEASGGMETEEGLKLDLERALLRLSPVERSCLHLAGVEEMSHQEIADILALPLGTVKSHITRGKEKLRAGLAGAKNAERSV